MNGSDRAGGSPPSRLGMQAIHTAGREVAAYELLYRAGTANYASLSSAAEHDRATAQVLGATFGEFGVEDLAGGRLLFLNATRSFFTGQLPLPIAPKNMVLELLETVDVDRWVLAGLLELKNRGFAVAIDDFAGEISRVPALIHADYAKIDMEAVADRLPDVVGLVRKVNPHAAIVVERIETPEQFQTCCDLGVDLFQGYLLHRPEVLERQTLTPSHVTCAQLIALLSDPEGDVEAVVDLLARDPGLSVRVLKTVSSAAHAPRGGITSLRQAVVMLGRRELMGWMVLILLSGSGAVRVPEDTLAWIFSRAEACRSSCPELRESAFTVGLLSAAAEALGLDVAELIRGCALEPIALDALLRGDGALGAALTSVRAHEALLRGDRRPAFDEGGMRSSSPVDAEYLRAQIHARARVVAFQGAGSAAV